MQKNTNKSEKIFIKVFVTKNQKFRVKVKQPDGLAYEVTVGSVSWNNGKGKEYEKIIRKKCELLVAMLESKLLVFRDINLELKKEF
jgi:hypothetical protein